METGAEPETGVESEAGDSSNRKPHAQTEAELMLHHDVDAVRDNCVDDDGVDDDDRHPDTESLVEASETWRELTITPFSRAKP